jgi:hypothetical protein
VGGRVWEEGSLLPTLPWHLDLGGSPALQREGLKQQGSWLGSHVGGGGAPPLELLGCGGTPWAPQLTAVPCPPGEHTWLLAEPDPRVEIPIPHPGGQAHWALVPRPLPGECCGRAPHHYPHHCEEALLSYTLTWSRFYFTFHGKR